MSNISLKDDFDKLAEALGMTSDKVSEKGNGINLPRLRIVKEGVLGETEIKGKTKSYQIVDPGSFVLDTYEDGSSRKIYGKQAKIRIFVQRFKFERYVTEDGKYINSILSRAQFEEDLPDTSGGMNCGRPHRGYIDPKVYDGMTSEEQSLQKTTKRVRVILGLVTFDSAIDDKGEEINLSEPTPFVWDITNNTAFKVSGELVGTMNASKILFPKREIVFGSEQKGEGEFKTFIPKVISRSDKDIKFTAKDQENLSMFLEWIEQTNTWVLNQAGNTEAKTHSIDAIEVEEPKEKEPKKVSVKKEESPAPKKDLNKILDEWDDDEE